ncbi:MAG TPA: CDP-diacylglycerol--serine O-phosphatidyltransferase [Spirochaetota bacterium]|nr:CDP-diacylglycerol--serine O-phosphatidyltransferase [Spirochaetota bacterium]HOM38907.1 CDP-diacylglycerol--serine O-phosphatidyltransferase [Spirochaetota bacterium]HPQ49114.1 CDP-diacylglycerol--serine O-phosphatidyltransferase [Spirochaetota bacterium]
MPKIVIPSIFTFLNMLSGFLSIYCSFNNNFEYASYLIMLASIFDMIDGRLARALKIISEVGKQLDSFSDFITFGTAPAFLFLNIMRNKINIYILIIISFIYVINATLRLSLYNIKESNPDEFKGMPSTFAGISISSILGFNYIGSTINITYFEINKYIFIPIFLIYAFLMVSNIKYRKFSSLMLRFNKMKNIFFNILFITLLILFFKYFMIIFVILYTLTPALDNYVNKKN